MRVFKCNFPLGFRLQALAPRDQSVGTPQTLTFKVENYEVQGAEAIHSESQGSLLQDIETPNPLNPYKPTTPLNPEPLETLKPLNP